MWHPSLNLAFDADSPCRDFFVAAIRFYLGITINHKIYLGIWDLRLTRPTGGQGHFAAVQQRHQTGRSGGGAEDGRSSGDDDQPGTGEGLRTDQMNRMRGRGILARKLVPEPGVKGRVGQSGAMKAPDEHLDVAFCAGFSDARHDAGGWARGCRRPRSAKARNRGGLSRSMGI